MMLSRLLLSALTLLAACHHTTNAPPTSSPTTSPTTSPPPATTATTTEPSTPAIEQVDDTDSPDVELAGTWTVDAIVSGKTTDREPWPTPATLRFTADGKLELFTGCNTGSGTYSVDGKQLTLGHVSITKRGCMDRMNELEVAVLAMFRGPQPVTVAVDGNRVLLRNGSGGIDLVGTDGGAGPE